MADRQKPPQIKPVVGDLSDPNTKINRRTAPSTTKNGEIDIPEPFALSTNPNIPPKRKDLSDAFYDGGKGTVAPVPKGFFDETPVDSTKINNNGPTVITRPDDPSFGIAESQTPNPLDSVPKTSQLGVQKKPYDVKGVKPDTLKVLAKENKYKKFEVSIDGTDSNIAIDVPAVAKAARLKFNDLNLISSILAGPANKNLTATWVYLLLHGSGAVGKTIRAKENNNKTDQPITIEGNMLMYLWTRGNSITKGHFNLEIEKAFKRTPAYKEKFFEDVGEIGHTLVASTDNLSNNPMTGSKQHVPSLLERALNSIHPKFTKELEKYINVLKGKAYLALPAGVLGSIQYAINYISGIISHIAQMINEIYQGVLEIIQEFIAIIDGIMGVIMNTLLYMIEQIIPLEILCFILDIISIFVGDLTFITNFLSSSLTISDVLSSFGIMPDIANFLSNPVSSLTSFLPEEVQNILNIIDEVGNDPLGYLGTVLSEYGYTYMAYYLQGDIMGGILNQFGSQAPVLYPLAAVFRKYGFTGKIQLVDPNEPSRNVKLPPFLVELRGNIERTFDDLGRDLVMGRNKINSEIFEIGRSGSLYPNTFGIEPSNFGIDSNTTS